MPHSIGTVGSSRKIELCAVSGIACSVCVYVAVRVFELHEGVVPVGMDFKPLKRISFLNNETLEFLMNSFALMSFQTAQRLAVVWYETHHNGSR